MKAFPEDVWIGLYTDDTSTDFKWSDGSEVTYTSWASGQPDGGMVSIYRHDNC